ncbi:AVAST type 2 anti-phage system protein Avs2 [Haliangium ochraceum]|uniref:AAA ATPase n=1 Tax=Haliangium ochraceum (strain DSM 14365 / JCM 11303 / SMP-2) TaxID=502025 RepID=D0LQS6_HALO1|nr:AVAST type 2 anti-phage system protein Avs2 [Haliangium ochraceum]ACY13636.1 conserved hypothetical protein [Haliangium ochraceum DSM 14365]
MSSPNLDWSAIRPLNRTRDRGFEELCAQLARSELPAGTQFIRKGTPDAGVECYAIFPDGSEWAWQAKYFLTSPEASQWQQVDKSVVTALEKHPAITKYFVCMPIDLPDGRVERTTRASGEKKPTTSAQDQWNERVKKWKAAARADGREVEFLFWGSHELLFRLAQPVHVGRVYFWFDKRGFDRAWFSARLEAALHTAGPRYTPEVHVDLPVAQDFDAFGRAAQFFERTKTLAPPIRDRLRTVQHSEVRESIPEIETTTTELSNAVQKVLDHFSALKVQPTGVLPFAPLITLIDEARTAADKLCLILEKHETEYDVKRSMDDTSRRSAARYRANPFRDRRFCVGRLETELHQAAERLRRADELSNGKELILCGSAGTGKTHLLCDVARRRIAKDCPTVLLMGQMFVNHDGPWPQVLQQLDLPRLSAEEFVGALEAAAQASGARALILLDAINEGSGRTIWPSHMAAFLSQIARSPWIGVVMAIRTSYEELVVPLEIRERATKVVHNGFREHEYDATRTFFLHYGLELPSTPLLDPEFRNPLFLKTLCRGLHTKGERRLPRGLHGITAVFDLYLGSVNERLATQLDFDRRIPLVRQALEAVAAALTDSGKRWLSLESAKTIVNALLPGRDFGRSLYRGLVVEGILVEEASRIAGNSRGDFVYVAYERFADHLVTKTLLDRHLDPSSPASAFGAGGGLAFINNSDDDIPPGLLEALWIQVPERCGEELSALVPAIADRWNAAEAFRQSLVWRAATAFSKGTHDALNSLCRSDRDRHETVDALLTLAVLPQHPFNARFLDQLLRRDSMPDRDAWWSISLHNAWGNHGGVDRLVDWASSLDPEAPLEDEVIELAGTALAWLFTSSHRYLRDRATKALVALYSGRLDSMSHLIEQFSDVDDPYVTERVYAAAYGVAMRAHNPAEVGSLALVVYEHVFASTSPPAHILLRDYARGVIERALYLHPDITIDMTRVRPPYSSHWPGFPSEVEIQPFLADCSRSSNESGELHWTRNEIASSVLDGDFARYVIGTNSSATGDWLTITLAEAAWEPPPKPEVLRQQPPKPEVLRQQLIEDLSAEERRVWDEFSEADEKRNAVLRPFVEDWFKERSEGGDRSLLDNEHLLAELEKARTPELDAVEAKWEKMLAILQSTLSSEHAALLDTIGVMEDSGRTSMEPPRLAFKGLQRYILKRVFDLGWTFEQFGRFDRFSTGSNDRRASKAERIGKKYQWIAYHELLALISDRFQYRERYLENDADKEYAGPWQKRLRDIDPSCTLRSTRGGTSWSGHTSAWWGPILFDATPLPGNEREWVQQTGDLPKIENLLCTTDTDDGIRWINAQGSFTWMQQASADREPTAVDRGELWYQCTGYLIHKHDTAAFLKWAEGVDFWGEWMPAPSEVYRVFLGEHAWSPAARYYGDGGWTQPHQDCPVKIRVAALEYSRESGGFDCSVDESYTLSLPVRELVTDLRLRWSGKGADYLDSSGVLAAQDPTVDTPGPDALLLRSDLLETLQRDMNLTLCWAVLGEKRILRGGENGPRYPSLRMSGAYVLDESGLQGFVKRILDDPNKSPRESQLLNTYRSP